MVPCLVRPEGPRVLHHLLRHWRPPQALPAASLARPSSAWPLPRHPPVQCHAREVTCAGMKVSASLYTCSVAAPMSSSTSCPAIIGPDRSVWGGMIRQITAKSNNHNFNISSTDSGSRQQWKYLPSKRSPRPHPQARASMALQTGCTVARTEVQPAQALVKMCRIEG